MKKILLTTVIISALLTGCQNNKTKTSEASAETEMIHEHHGEAIHEHEHDNAEMTLDNSWKNEIQLNNGNKWEANRETTLGVDKMLALLKENNPKTVEDYHQLASKLNDESNTVIQKCSMEGPSHDNLHVFLHPLIEKIDSLGKVSTTEKGAEITASLQENLDEYYNYFK